MEGVTYYPGSFGEIIQGRINGKDLLMSCPVNLFTRVRIFETKNPINKFKNEKSRRLLESVLNLWGYEKYAEDLDIEIASDIPRGKGFASSTADLCGVYHSLLKIFKREFNQQELISECIKIEPTDSIIFDSMTLLDYKKGSYSETLGSYLKFYILAFEGNRSVDTVKFNSSELPPLKDISFVMNHIKEGIQKENIENVALASTISITGNLHRVNYEILPEVIKIKEKTGGLGILGAHSGDALGIIYRDINDLYKVMKYAGEVKNYKCYPLETLRSVYYEDNYDYSAIKW